MTVHVSVRHYLVELYRKDPKVRASDLARSAGVSSASLHRWIAEAGATRRVQANHQARPRLATAWRTMKARCDRPEAKAYRHTGARGITYCAEWRVYEAFEQWALANGWRPDLSLDRIDPDGHYEPANCRWIEHSINSGRRRNAGTVTGAPA